MLPWEHPSEYDTDEQQAINEQREGIEDYYNDLVEASYYDEEEE